ncbi:MAG TPA: VWA domain-containing protein [Kofleriaceae bacterium]|nr:VWA domain-containing protein [Kofleriaceae bacterium]
MARALGPVVALLLSALACSGAKAPPGRPPPSAASKDPRLVELSLDPTADKVLADQLGELAVRIRVSAAALPPGKRPPLNLTLVLDVSGSMEGEAIEEAKAAAHRMIERLTAHDRAALVVFHSTGEVLVPSQPVTTRARVEFAQRITAITARGTTDMATGLQLALAQAAAGRVPGSIDRIVLLGDGVPNDARAIPGLVASAQAQRFTITTLGLGVDYDAELLAGIATDTGGRYTYLASPDEVARVFDEELIQMRRVIGKNLALNLIAGPGVTLEPMEGFQPMGNGLYAVLGDLSAGEVRDVIVPLKVAGRGPGATVELMDASLTFEDAAAGAGALTRTGFAKVKADPDEGAVRASIKVAIATARARAQAASAMLAAIVRARAADLPGAQQILDAAEATARQTATATGDADLLALVAQMVALRQDLPEIARAAQQALLLQRPLEGPAPAPATSAPRAVEDRVRRAEQDARDVMSGRGRRGP